MSDLDFSQKTVLVVGGSSGIGNGIAQAFRKRGATVHVTGTKPAASDYANIQDSSLTGLTYAQLDLVDPSSLDAWQPSFARLDVLVLSQGSVRYERQEFEPAIFNQMVSINLNSVMACSIKFHGMLAASRGSLIAISSAGGFRAVRANPAYAASKAGVVGLVRTLGNAWAGDGIRVNGIAPGLVPTKLTRVTTDHPQRLAERLKGIPMGRLGTIEDIAGAALFLASPLAAYIAGQTIIVDGGRTLA